MNELLAAGAMALLAMASVGLWTLRVALTARGRRPIAATVAAVEAVVFAVAFTNVAAHLDSPVRIAGYAGGVAFGTVALYAVLVVELLAVRRRAGRPDVRSDRRLRPADGRTPGDDQNSQRERCPRHASSPFFDCALRYLTR